MQKKLRELRTTNDPFWIELSIVLNCHPRPLVAGGIAEDIVPNPEDNSSLDDSDISLCDSIKELTKSLSTINVVGVSLLARTVV